MSNADRRSDPSSVSTLLKGLVVIEPLNSLHISKTCVFQHYAPSDIVTIVSLMLLNYGHWIAIILLLYIQQTTFLAADATQWSNPESPECES